MQPPETTQGLLQWVGRRWRWLLRAADLGGGRGPGAGCGAFGGGGGAGGRDCAGDGGSERVAAGGRGSQHESVAVGRDGRTRRERDERDRDATDGFESCRIWWCLQVRHQPHRRSSDPTPPFGSVQVVVVVGAGCFAVQPVASATSVFVDQVHLWEGVGKNCCTGATQCLQVVTGVKQCSGRCFPIPFALLSTAPPSSSTHFSCGHLQGLCSRAQEDEQQHTLVALEAIDTERQQTQWVMKAGGEQLRPEPHVNTAN